MATRFRKIYGGRELAFELLGSVFCYSRSSAGQDFAHSSLLGEGCRPDTNPSTHAPHSLILLYEEYRSIGAGSWTSPPNTKFTLICGLVAPLVLCKNGIPVRPIEKALDYQIGVRGNGIQPHPRILGQCTAEAMLRSHLSRLGVTVELGTGLVDFTQDAHKNETLEVDCVTRKHLGISFWGEMREKLPFLVADVDMERLDREYCLIVSFRVLPFPWVQLLTPQWWVMGLRNKYKMSSKYYVGLEASLVMKNLSPRSLLSTYETERMPPIKEMLKLVTNLHTPLWEPTRGRRAPDAPNLVLGPVVAEDGAGPTTMTLFDRLRPFSHTALVFKLPEGPPAEPPSPASTQDVLHALGKYNKDGHRLVDSHLVLPENTPDAGSGRVIRYESGARRYSRSRPEGI
ncbi:hypothetical protein BS47DRAFT_1362259 [Hydnum rufescens UP504]|uniref:Uncharacterized protein n=1 Tax=Hydnum rufescens UP504 TaxID=1448309 RepID=A0A9P6AXN8_9AGAM|nr:hypothetical protein BS47DRAFT_1362259 [Hydnum rufescens UP504]